LSVPIFLGPGFVNAKFPDHCPNPGDVTHVDTLKQEEREAREVISLKRMKFLPFLP
jgi:hypothetical protein